LPCFIVNTIMYIYQSNIHLIKVHEHIIVLTRIETNMVSRYVKGRSISKYEL